MLLLLVLGGVAGLSGLAGLFKKGSAWQRFDLSLWIVVNLVFLAGFVLICWFHFQINRHLPLLLPDDLVPWLNRQLEAMNSRSAYGLPLYDPASPPRYAIPVWIENEKYFFWFLCYAIMALIAHCRLAESRFRAVLLLFLSGQIALLYFAADPFAVPLPQFFGEVAPWLQGNLPPRQQFGLFMQLYPKMVFYYNAHYMWLHPPLLFLSYACITIVFITSSFMLARRVQAIETLGYDFAKLGYFLLTLGMLLGYPWALQAWGPNWWWDPKICSSIMMWALFSTYLHTRLYANKPAMWYFSSVLGILCFVAMIFTFITSFYFPGQHTFQ